MASKVSFERWNPRDQYSIPYAVYVAHCGELRKMYRTMISSHAYVYKSLNNDRGALWKDSPSKFFEFPSEVKKTNAFFTNLKEWSVAYNDLENWTNLNALIAITGNFETYLVKIIKLSLESDVGVLYGMSHKLDGIIAIKNGHKYDFTKEVTSCTKGEWTSRINYLNKYFGRVPSILSDNVEVLDKMRRTRNNMAHSFGRNIEAAQEIHEIGKLKMEKLDSKKLLTYWDLIDNCVRELDKQLYREHIGEYQMLIFYNAVENDIISKMDNKMINTANKARQFRKMYGNMDKNGKIALGQNYCKGLIEYYESI